MTILWSFSYNSLVKFHGQLSSLLYIVQCSHFKEMFGAHGNGLCYKGTILQRSTPFYGHFPISPL